MKPLKVFFIFFILHSSIGGCYSQQLVKTIRDAPKVKENEELFIGKTLKDFLKEIKPKIKTAFGNPGINGRKEGGYFRFNFVTRNEYDSLKTLSKIPVTIVVYVKDYFEWDYQKRTKGKELAWTKEDEEKYGDLTIMAFRVFGEAIIEE